MKPNIKNQLFIFRILEGSNHLPLCLRSPIQTKSPISQLLLAGTGYGKCIIPCKFIDKFLPILRLSYRYVLFGDNYVIHYSPPAYFISFYTIIQRIIKFVKFDMFDGARYAMIRSVSKLNTHGIVMGKGLARKLPRARAYSYLINLF